MINKKIRYLFFLAIITLMTDCKCGLNRSGFKFSKLQESFVNSYRLNDTVYFKNQSNDFDTILISKIDSIDRYGAILGFPRKSISINIKHLPKNSWTDGIELSQDGDKKILSQTLITIEKTDIKNPNNIYIGISYRDFFGILTDTNQIFTNQISSDLSVANHWEIDSWNKDKKHETPLITKVIWTKKFGLTGYYKGNGDFYKIQP
jgi:hypothetical protein